MYKKLNENKMKIKWLLFVYIVLICKQMKDNIVVIFRLTSNNANNS